MNTQPFQNQNMNGGSNDIMNMLKTQMLTMTMVSSMNGTNSNQNIFGLFYVLIVTQVIDFLTKNIPGLAKPVFQ
jgi:hypothetical protein